MRAFLELHPGTHNLKDLEATVKSASAAARSLARKGLATFESETVPIAAGAVRAPHTLNAPQQAAFDAIRSAIEHTQFHIFLLHGVTGSGKVRNLWTHTDLGSFTGSYSVDVPRHGAILVSIQ